MNPSLIGGIAEIPWYRSNDTSAL